MKIGAFFRTKLASRAVAKGKWRSDGAALVDVVTQLRLFFERSRPYAEK